MITELHDEEGQVMSSNVVEVIQTLELPETCLQNKSEANKPVYSDQLRLILTNSMQFVRVNTKEKVGPTEVLFEPAETHRVFQRQMTAVYTCGTQDN